MIFIIWAAAIAQTAAMASGLRQYMVLLPAPAAGISFQSICLNKPNYKRHDTRIPSPDRSASLFSYLLL
jgi:hypothetical protein